MIGTIILITLIGAVISIVIGSVWYSPGTPMGKMHMRTIGFDKLSPEEQKKCIEDAKPHMWKSYLGQFLLSALISLFIAFITVVNAAGGQPHTMVYLYGLFVWLCFVVPVTGSNIIWGNTPRDIVWKKFFSDIMSYAVPMALIILIAGLFV